jgi:hypothetical protein
MRASARHRADQRFTAVSSSTSSDDQPNL